MGKNKNIKKPVPSAKPTVQPMPVGAKRPWAYLGILAMAVIVIYFRTSWFDYVNIDDSNLMYSNPTVVDPELPFSACFKQMVFSAYYKPLVFASWRLQYQLWGPEAGHFHTVNWILHLCNTLLLFWIARILFERVFQDEGKKTLAAFFLALLFSVNPLRVESVSWVTERKDVLFSFFLLLSWLLYLWYRKTRQYAFMILGAVAYLCSGLSKSMGFPFVAVIFFMDFYFGEKWSFRQALFKMPYYLSFLALTILYGFANFLLPQPEQVATVPPDTSMDFFVQAENQISSLPYIASLPEWLQIVVTTCARIVLWILHCFLPFNTSIIYSHNEVYGYIGQGIFLYPLFVAFLFWYAWKVRKKHSYLLAGLVFYLIIMVPVLAIPESGQAIFMSDRYTYIPSIGLFFILVSFVIQRFSKASAQYAVLGGMAVIFFIESNRIVGNWKNSETLFSRALEIYPESGLAHLNLGLYYRQIKDYDKALAVYSEGVQYSRGYLQLYANRSRILLDRGQADLALADLNYCLSKNPNLVNALTNRGVAYAMKNNLDSALIDLTKALALEPNEPDVLSNRGLVYFQMGRYAESISDLKAYIALKPEDADNINLLGLAYMNGGQGDKALVEFNRSIQIKPNESAFYYNRSIIYRQRRDRKNELADLLKASSLGYQVDPNYIRQLQQ